MLFLTDKLVKHKTTFICRVSRGTYGIITVHRNTSAESATNLPSGLNGCQNYPLTGNGSSCTQPGFEHHCGGAEEQVL
jgi:hypothetical protein